MARAHTSMQYTAMPKCGHSSATMHGPAGSPGSAKGSSTMSARSRTPVSEQHGNNTKVNTRNRFGTLTSQGKHQGRLDPGAGKGF